MSKFQKIAVFLIRVFGVIGVMFGLNGFIYAVMLTISPMFRFDGFDSTQGLISGAFYLIWGIAFLLFSGPLGRLIGRGLDD